MNRLDRARGFAAGTAADPVAGFIREQPRAVAETYRAMRHVLRAREIPFRLDIALVGAGSSYNALASAAPRIAAAAGAPVHLRAPMAFMSDVAGGQLRPNLAVVLSRSGANITSIEAVRLALDCGFDMVRITAHADSSFARLAPGTFVMPIGAEPVGPRTKGYSASLAALEALTDWIAGREGQDPQLSDQFVEACRAGAESLADELAGVDFILILGQGVHLGTALEASLKISEMSGIPSAGFDIEDALHGRLQGLTARSLVVFIAGQAIEEPAARAAAGVMRDLGVAARVVGPAFDQDIFRVAVGPSEPSTELDPFRAIIPFQWLAWALARRRGLDPACARYPSLSQRLAPTTSAPR
jgi:glucosamine--fructose-6-phosphate aminotransferase (isomerizing)